MQLEEIRKLLEAPDDTKDEFWDSGELIWIDWRDFDDSIINYFNKKLPDEDKIQFECVESEKERGIDIFSEKGRRQQISSLWRRLHRQGYDTEEHSGIRLSQVSDPLVYGVPRKRYSGLLYWADFPVGAAGTGIRGRKRRLLFFLSPGRQRHV